MVARAPRLLEDNAWIFPHSIYWLISRDHCPFHLAIPLIGQLLWGSRGTPHNVFQGIAQALPTVKVIRELCPQTAKF